jgi:hypothetical protein
MNTLKLAKNLLLATLVTTVALSALAVPAVAQGSSPIQTSFTVISAEPQPTTPLKVDLDPATVTVHWKYQMPQTGVSALGAVQSSATLTWSWTPADCNKPGIVLLGSFSQSVDLGTAFVQNQGNTGDKTSTFTVKVTEEAPGETTIQCAIHGQVGAVGNAPASNTADAKFSIVAAYRGLLSTSVENAIGEAGPQAPITYNLRIDNVGNSESNVNFALVENKVAADSGWQPVIPGSFVLESARKGGTTTSRTIPFQISTPHKNGWNNQETTFQLKIQPSSQKDTANLGQEYTVTMLARVRGVYVPGPEPLLLVAAVLGTALIARHLRRDE